jgi:hypothetical protein
MEKVLKLQLQNLSHIVCSSFLFWTLYFEQGGMVIQFHIKKFVHMGWTNQKVQPKIKIKKFCTFLKYLPPNLLIYLVR